MNHIEIISKEIGYPVDWVKSQIENYPTAPILSINEALAAMAELQKEIDRLETDLICDACLGQLHENCGCRGTGSILTLIKTLRQENFRLKAENEKLYKGYKFKP